MLKEQPPNKKGQTGPDSTDPNPWLGKGTRAQSAIFTFQRIVPGRTAHAWLVGFRGNGICQELDKGPF